MSSDTQSTAKQIARLKERLATVHSELDQMAIASRNALRTTGVRDADFQRSVLRRAELTFLTEDMQVVIASMEREAAK
jgi:hypothetical protein